MSLIRLFVPITMGSEVKEAFPLAPSQQLSSPSK